jgi:hypothetical protein
VTHLLAPIHSDQKIRRVPYPTALKANLHLSLVQPMLPCMVLIPLPRVHHLICGGQREHMPVADEECHIMLLEPVSTRNTGNLVNEWTVKELDTLD